MSMSAKAFDLQPLLEAVSGDEEILSQVISMFVSSTRENLDTIREAIVRNDGDLVKMTAHHLKGSLLELGAAGPVAIALQLEKMGSRHELAGADKVWQELDASIADLVAALDQTEYRRSA